MREWDRSSTYNWETNKYEYDKSETPVYILAEEWDGEGYDWGITSIVARKVGDTFEYAVYEDGGCSCNSAYEGNPEGYDLSWNTDAKAVLKSAVSDMTVADAVDFRTEFLRSQKELLIQLTAKITAGLNERLANA